ncbi:MAG: toll/interleukin-1 receptor domain-containing protein [Planctomycetes bacterium]|nr:toll/interleukin-1 receptor domain-containing protein [Planctomycetota bacterium]
MSAFQSQSVLGLRGLRIRENVLAMTYCIFLAYPEHQLTFARAVKHDLQPRTVFVAKDDVPPGQAWMNALPAVQRQAHASILLLDNIGVRSPYVQDEIITAIRAHRSARRPLLPVFLDDSSSPYGLGGFQAVRRVGERDHEVLADIREWATRNLSCCSPVAGRQSIATAGSSLSGPSTPLPLSSDGHVRVRDFPRGPLVDAKYAGLELIQGVAEVVPVDDAIGIIRKANELRREADPGDDRPMMIPETALPGLRPARHFWHVALDQARLQGPRMYAALMLAIPYTQLPATAAEARTRFILDHIDKI